MSTLSLIANIVTLLAFIITIWQLVVMNGRLAKVEAETKRKFKVELDRLKVRDILSLIQSILDDFTVSGEQELTVDRIRMIIFKMQSLKDSLVDTNDNNLVNQYGRYDHAKLVSSISANLILLREACKEMPSSMDTRFICENLQNLRDSMKLIEKHFNQ